LGAVHCEPSIAASSSFIAEPYSTLLLSLPLPSRQLPSRLLQAVQSFIAKPSIASRRSL
jgi:hypothetical protein